MENSPAIDVFYIMGAAQDFSDSHQRQQELLNALSSPLKASPSFEKSTPTPGLLAQA
jgi:hypothetical protein